MQVILNLGKSCKAQLRRVVGKSCKAQLRRVVGKSCKAQLRIQEMSFMLVAVLLFFILAGLFFVSIFYSNLYERANEISEIRTQTAITSLSDSPEFACTGSRSNCVDSDKLIVLINKKDYEKFWPFSSLMVMKSKAFNKSENEMTDCSLSNYPDCDIFNIYKKDVKNERLISSFVALCSVEYENRYVYEKCEIAKIIAGTEIRNIEV